MIFINTVIASPSWDWVSREAVANGWLFRYFYFLSASIKTLHLKLIRKFFSYLWREVKQNYVGIILFALIVKFSHPQNILCGNDWIDLPGPTAGDHLHLYLLISHSFYWSSSSWVLWRKYKRQHLFVVVRPGWVCGYFMILAISGKYSTPQ